MKLAWNSLSVALGILLSAPTSMVLAEPTPVSESASPIFENSELNSISSTDTLVIPEITPVLPEPTSTYNASTLVIPEITPVISSTPTVEETQPTAQPDATNQTTITPNSESGEATETPTADESQSNPEELAKLQKLREADQLYLGGQFAAAQELYRQVKDPFFSTAASLERVEPITDPEMLSPAGRVYWRMGIAGLEQNLETKIFVPLQLLVENNPEFIPGHLKYAQALQAYNRSAEALEVLERATTLYPDQPDLLRAKIGALQESKQWLEASLAARQFALLNPHRPEAEQFALIADENLERYQSNLREQLTGNTIANIITGALGVAFTGNVFAPISAIQTTTLMLRGESAVGERVANQAKEQLELIEDEQVLNYVREIGNRLATVAGRKDFNYEFYVVKDNRLNAFALPGGKVFINAGAIAHSNSEAELAGLIAHELSHTVLSHGFQLVTEGNFVASLLQYIPYGGTVTDLAVLNYSRDMERQADILGTRLLTSTGYAADGLRNLMVTMENEEQDRPIFSWLSSHPGANERVGYLETLIQRNGYNRYAYEGVERHSQVKARVKQLLGEGDKSKERRILSEPNNSEQ